jgi:hypothetical protein
LQMHSPQPIKRSKRRENSVDEDSSARAEILKAKRNMDETSKSFLAFSDTQIASNITTLGVSLAINITKSVESMAD